MLRLNLGSGFEKKEGWVNVDIVPDADIQADLTQDWDFVEPGSVDEVFSSNVFEHLPDPLHTMNELYKVLKIGGKAEIVVPSTDGRGAFQDPTHRSFWNRNSFEYYSSSANYGYWALCQRYGFKGNFNIIELSEFPVHDMIIFTKCILEKV